MKRYFILGITVFVLFQYNYIYCIDNDFETEKNNILYSAETTFKDIKEGKYKDLWAHLTKKSKEYIVNDIYKAIIKAGVKTYLMSDISEDFERGGPLARSFWDTYNKNFNVDIVLEHSRWDIFYIKVNDAELHITYEKSSNPVKLNMNKEQGQWKCGLAETYWKFGLF